MNTTDSINWTDKYKPTKLDEVVSHDLQLQLLKQQVKIKKQIHMIIYGPSGVGKTATILAYAKEIYPINTKSFILELNASDERGIEIIRDKICLFASTVNLFVNSTKMIIIDDSDLMTKDAQIALKKIIELYSKNCKFYIICNNINKIIPEIQSRCIKINFKNIDNSAALKKLNYICKNEHINISKNSISLIISLCKYDLRKMINLLQILHTTYNTKININNIYNYLNILTIKEKNNLKINIKNMQYSDIYIYLSNLIITKNYSISDIINIIFDYIINITKDDLSIEDNKLIANSIIQLSNIEFDISNEFDTPITIGAILSIIWKIKHFI